MPEFLEVKIGKDTYRMVATTIGIQLDVEAWSQRQILLRASEGVAEDHQRAQVMAEAGRLAAATWYYSLIGQQIRGTLIGQLFHMWRATSDQHKSLTFDAYQQIVRKNPADYEAAMSAYAEFNAPKKETPSSGDGEATP